MSKYTPTKKLASTSTVMIRPWTTQSRPILPAKTPSLALRGLRFMMSPSASSMPSASAGKQSVTRFTHSSCTGWKMVKPMSVAINTENTSARLAESRNWMTLRMLS